LGAALAAQAIAEPRDGVSSPRPCRQRKARVIAYRASRHLVG